MLFTFSEALSPIISWLHLTLDNAAICWWAASLLHTGRTSQLHYWPLSISPRCGLETGPMSVSALHRSSGLGAEMKSAPRRMRRRGKLNMALEAYGTFMYQGEIAGGGKLVLQTERIWNLYVVMEPQFLLPFDSPWSGQSWRELLQHLTSVTLGSKEQRVEKLMSPLLCTWHNSDLGDIWVYTNWNHSTQTPTLFTHESLTFLRCAQELRGNI